MSHACIALCKGIRALSKQHVERQSIVRLLGMTTVVKALKVPKMDGKCWHTAEERRAV